MKDRYIKLLAKELIENTIDKSVADSILKRLSKRNLKKLLFHLKKELANKQVYLESAEALDSKVLRELEHIFEGKEVIATINMQAVGGLKVQENDIILDLTIQNTIIQTIKKLESTL